MRSRPLSLILIFGLLVVSIIGVTLWHSQKVHERAAIRRQADAHYATIREDTIAKAQQDYGGYLASKSQISAEMQTPFPIIFSGQSSVGYTLSLKNTGDTPVYLSGDILKISEVYNDDENQEDPSASAQVSITDNLNAYPDLIAPHSVWTGVVALAGIAPSAAHGGYSGYITILGGLQQSGETSQDQLVSIPLGLVIRKDVLPKLWWEF
jgi:hypothetical protein